MIVDAQVHIWGANTPDRPWPGGRSEAHRPGGFSADEALQEMNAAGVDRVVIAPPSWEGDRNDLALDAARRHPDRFAIMGRLALERPERRGVLDGWKAQPGMLGLRFTFGSASQRGWLTDGTAGLKLIIDHLGMPLRTKDDEAFADLPQLRAMAKRPNVAAKASALPCCSSEPYPYRGVHARIRQVFDAFGPRRMFWGTDLTRLPCTYRQAVTLFTEDLPWLAAADQELVMGRGICDWLGWPLPR